MAPMRHAELFGELFSSGHSFSKNIRWCLTEEDLSQGTAAILF
jgi:hypothetical protein